MTISDEKIISVCKQITRLKNSKSDVKSITCTVGDSDDLDHHVFCFMYHIQNCSERNSWGSEAFLPISDY